MGSVQHQATYRVLPISHSERVNANTHLPNAADGTDWEWDNEMKISKAWGKTRWEY